MGVLSRFVESVSSNVNRKAVVCGAGLNIDIWKAGLVRGYNCTYEQEIESESGC